MMKKCLTLLAIALVATVAKAAENYALKVTLNENTSATYVLNTKPVVTYSGSNVIIKAESLEDSYRIDEVKSFTFVDGDSAGADAITMNVTYGFRDNIFTCEGYHIRVFNLSGCVVATGNGSVSLEGLDDGIYIVNAGDRSIKVVKK